MSPEDYRALRKSEESTCGETLPLEGICTHDIIQDSSAELDSLLEESKQEPHLEESHSNFPNKDLARNRITLQQLS